MTPDVHLALHADLAVVWMPTDLRVGQSSAGTHYGLTLSQLIDLLDAGASAVLEWDKHHAPQQSS